MEEEGPRLALVVWEGDSREVLRSFPASIRREFGMEIFDLQRGQRPRSFRPMPSIGKGVFELKQRDSAGWYRVIYLSRAGDTLYMLHTFKKQSAKTSKKDLSIAKSRLKVVLAALRPAKRIDKKTENENG